MRRSTLFLASQTQYFIFQIGRNPEVRIPLKIVDNRPQLLQQTHLLGPNQDAQNSNRSKTDAPSDVVAMAFVNQDSVRTNLQRKRKSGLFTRIEIFALIGSGMLLHPSICIHSGIANRLKRGTSAASR
jgi:hypothetical protein